MAKLTEQKLYADLQKLTPGKWYNIEKHPEYDLMVKFLKSFIDVLNEEIEFKPDFKSFKVYRDKSSTLEIKWSTIAGYKAAEHSCPPDKYGKQAKYREIFINDKLVAIESL